MKLYEDIATFATVQTETASDKLFAGKVKETLEAMGYELIPDEASEETEDGGILEPGSVRYLETPYEGYRVMAKVDKKGALTTRLVREAEDEEASKGETDETRDREIGKRWCRDFDIFLSKMKDTGMPLDVTVRHEPDEAKIIAAPDKTASKKRARKSSRKRESDMKMLARGDDEK
jgi:hypothetical protein